MVGSVRIPEIRKKLLFTGAMLALTAGTVLLMWFGELITQRGIGNGISLMIFASIISRIPHGVSAWWTNPDQVFKVMMPFIALAVSAHAFSKSAREKIEGAGGSCTVVES